MNRHQLPAAALVAVALLLTGACGADNDKGGTPSPANDDLIVYSEKPEESVGVTVKKVADVNKLTGAPEDFKQFVAGMIAASTGMFVDKDCPFSVGVDKIDTRGGYAIGSMFTCGGAAFIWSKRDGVWQQIWGGQDVPACADLSKYSVPKSIAGKQCFDGKTIVDYTG